MKRILLNCLALFGAIGVASAAKIITVNTADNTDFSAGKTNLVRAITSLGDGDTIRFNIPGAGVHYLLTPVNGYPLITNNSITIDGYSQPGAVPNSNPIHAANNAQLKVVLSSTNGNGTAIVQAALAATGYGSFAHAGFNDIPTPDLPMLAFFRGTNHWVKGLAFQSSTDGTALGSAGPLFGIGFMADEPGRQPWLNANGSHWHISGCWFGLDPATGQPVYTADGNLASPRHAIDTERNRNAGTITNVNYPDSGAFGVAANSTNPRAEFNVVLSGWALNVVGANYRICGNFFNVLPDGMNNYDIAQAPNALAYMGDAFIEIGRQPDNILIGTDGDGVNDDQEGNLFGGTSANPLNPIAKPNYYYLDFYYGPSPSIPSGGTNIVIAGNYFGVAVDGVTRFTNACVVMHSFAGGSPASTARFGSDFDGVSDALEANVLCNNYPFSTQFPNPQTVEYTPESVFDGTSTSVGGMNAGVRLSFRGNVTIGNDLLPYKYANSFSSLLTPFLNYEAPYMNTSGSLIPVLNPVNIFPQLSGTFPVGINGYTTVTLDIYDVDPEGWANGQLFQEPELALPSSTSGYGGFPQGKRYLGSVTVPNTGSFTINVPANSGAVTVTVNYSADPVGTHNGRVHTSNFSDPGYVLPAGATSVGLTQIVPDVACWFDTALGASGAVTNGFINLANQPVPASLGTWEPYISSLGDSTFLIEFNTYANDGSLLNQNNAIAKQPAAGGPAKVGYAFYGDNGTPFPGQINLSRQNGNPGRVAGDLRYGATKFITEAEVSIGQLAAFQTAPNRWGANNIYQGTARYCGEQIFSLDPATLTQTPVTKAWDFVYGNHVGNMGVGADTTQVMRTGGRPNFLDNGNIVVMIDDKTAISSTSGEVTTFAIIQPDGTIVKGPTLVDPRNIFDNMCAFKGGFCVRVHQYLYFYDNNGNPTHTNNVIGSSGINFNGGLDGDRGDGHHVAGDIRSYYVYFAGKVNGNGTDCAVAAWDSRTGQFVGSSTVSDGDPTVQACDRTSLAVDGLDRVCVAYQYLPTPFYGSQIAARVAQFDGQNFNWQTHSFFPFVNHDQDPNNVLGYTTASPSVAMTPRQICIAAKGTINTANNVAAGPDSGAEQTVYTVLSTPVPVAAPQPTLSMTKAGSNLNLAWNPDAGLFTVQTRASLSSGVWANATAGNVATPVTIAAGAGPLFVRLVR